MDLSQETKRARRWLPRGLFALAVLPFAVTWWGGFVLVGVVFAERLTYLPSAGLCFLVGPLMAPPLAPPRVWVRRFILGLTAAGTERSVVRPLNWRDARSLWERDVLVAPLSSQIWTCLGTELCHAGDSEGALRALPRGVEISRPSDEPDARPRSHEALEALARLLAQEATAATQSGGTARASALAPECDWATSECLRLNPSNSEIFSLHAIRHLQRGWREEARRVFEQSVSGRRPDAIALLNFADMQRREGDLADARATLERTGHLPRCGGISSATRRRAGGTRRARRSGGTPRRREPVDWRGPR